MSAPYRPGQSPWPGNQPQRPDRPPPIRFHEEPAASSGSSGLDWALRIVGLVAVAVISGFAWWFFNNEPPQGSTPGVGDDPSSTEQNAGEFAFTQVDRTAVDEDCGEHAYGQIQDFLRQTPCEGLLRAVYTTTIEGRTIFTSVSVVEMADESQAKQLRDLTDTDNTGNVSDLVREGEVEVEGLETLSGGGGYDSSQSDREVIIVESDYDPGASEGGTEDELDRVCRDALRLAKKMADTEG